MRLFTKNEKRILLVTNIAHFLAHAFIISFPSIATPLSGEFGLPFDAVLKISFLMYLFYGLCALPSGFLSDKIHPRISLTIYFFGIGIAGLFTSFSQTKLQLQLSLMLLGIFASIYHPAGIGLLSKAIKNKGMALGINGIYGNIGIAAGPFIAGIITYLMGWRYIYIIMSIPSLIMGVLLQFISMDIHLERDAQIGASKTSENENSSTTKISYFIILCVSIVLAGFMYRGQTLILPTYFERKIYFLHNFVKTLDFLNVEGTKILSATILASLVYIVGIIGQLIGGKIADRYDLRYAYTLFFTSALPFIIMMYFFNNLPLFISSIFFILFSFGVQPIENSLIAKFTPHKWRNTSYGIKFILAFGVSSFVIYPVGFIQNHFSLESIFLLLSIVTFFVIINCFFLIISTRGLSFRN